MIKNEVSDGQPYDYSNKKGSQPVSLWVQPKGDQINESVVFATALSLTDDSGPEIEFSVPRRKWPSLKILNRINESLIPIETCSQRLPLKLVERKNPKMKNSFSMLKLRTTNQKKIPFRKPRNISDFCSRYSEYRIPRFEIEF